MSLRLRLFRSVSRALVRRLAERAAEPEPLRRLLDRMARWLLRLPPHTVLTETLLADDLPALVVSNRPGSRPVRPGRILLYLHGGAFVAGRPKNFAGMLGRLARLTRCEVIAPDYRLAPEHPFPAAVNDSRAAWDALIARGYRPENIVLGGDSAGGNLALVLLAGLLAEGTRPAGLFAFSPVTDLTFSGRSIEANAMRDPVLPVSCRGDLLRYYLPGAAPDDPRASPLCADYRDPPPVFLQFSETEILADDSRRMARRLEAAGGKVVLDPWPDTPHVWVLLDGILPEARIGLQRAAIFVNSCLEAGQAGVETAGSR